MGVRVWQDWVHAVALQPFLLGTRGPKDVQISAPQDTTNKRTECPGNICSTALRKLGLHKVRGMMPDFQLTSMALTLCKTASVQSQYHQCPDNLAAPERWLDKGGGGG